MYYSDQNDVRTTSIQYYSVLQSTTPVLLRTTKYYSVLQSTTPVLLLTTKYYSVLQSTTSTETTSERRPSSTTPYYKVLLQYCFVLQSTTPYYKVLLHVLLLTTKYYSVLQTTSERRPSSTTPYYKVLLQYYLVLLQYYSVLQSTTPVLQSTTPALLRTTKYYSSTTKYYSVLQSTTPVLLRTTNVLLQYYSVLQSTTPVLQSTTPYYKVLLQYYSVLQTYYKVLLRTTNVLQSTQYYSVLQTYYSSTTKYYSSTTPYYKRTTKYYSVLQTYYKVLLRTTEYYSSTKASKTSISCEASSTFQGASFQNEHFVRGFLNFSRNKLPKRAFRARLPQLFKEQASKTSISCEASSTFPGTSFQNEHFVRGFRNFSSDKLPKRAFRTRLPQLFNQGASKVLRLPRKTRKWPLTLKVWSVKTSISCDTSFKFHTFNSKIDDFVRVFLVKPFLQSSKSMTFAKLPPLFKTITKSCACHDICSSVTFARHCHCDSWKQHLRHVIKCCACHDIAKGHITKCCTCHEKTSRLHWHTAKVLRLSRKTRKRPHILWLGNAKTSISCETSSTFHTLKVRIVSQCECTAQWQRINELATTTRRRHDDDTTTTPKRAFRARFPPLFTLWR